MPGSELSHRRGPAGRGLLGALRHELTFALEFHRAECEFLTGERRRRRSAWRCCHAAPQTSSIWLPSPACGWISTRPWTGATAPSRWALDYLRRVGIEWSAHPTKEEVTARIRADLAAAREPPDRGAARPAVMTDPVWRATMDVLTVVMSPALFTDQNLLSSCHLSHGESQPGARQQRRIVLRLCMARRDARTALRRLRGRFRFGSSASTWSRSAGWIASRPVSTWSSGTSSFPGRSPSAAGRGLMRRAFDAAQEDSATSPLRPIAATT